MLCYKVKITLDEPIPEIADTTENDFGQIRRRVSYDENAVKTIQKGLDDFDEKNHGKCCAFIYYNSNDIISLGVLINDKVSLSKRICELMGECKISGSFTSEEIVFRNFERLSRETRDTVFNFDRDYLQPYDLDQFKPGNHRAPRERICAEYTYYQIKKQAYTDLCDDTLIPELDRIAVPPAIEETHGHPVHYIVRGACSLNVCDQLIAQLHEGGRLLSKHYLILGEMTLRKDDFFGDSDMLSRIFRSSAYSALVIDLRDYYETTLDRICSNYLTDELFEHIREYKRDTLVIFALSNSLEKAADIIKKSLPDMTFVEINERLAMNDDAKAVLRAYCEEDNVPADEALLSSVVTDKGYYANDLRNLYDIWYSNALKTKVYPQYSQFKKNLQLEADKAPEGGAYKKLQEMIGLKKAKAVIDQAITYSKMQKLLADKGMPNSKRSMHMVFMGYPGTAKTTVARLFAQILKDNKVLSVGDLIECGRSDLVGQFVGSTAVRVKKLFTRAKGSVLFIDEAYSLVDDRKGLFGDEAINTIVQEMENNREDMVVIFAGYPNEMKEFVKRNPGLKSRISFYIDFENYSSSELYDITKLIAKNNGYRLAENTSEVLIPIFDNALNSEDFGNGRFARNMLEHAQLAQAVRLSKSENIDSLTGDELITLNAEDFYTTNTITVTQNKVQPRRIGFAGA